MASARVEVRGVVQGVGFRPFVHRVATELGLDGVVGNDANKVFIEAAGTVEQLEQLVAAIETSPPPLARVDSVQSVLPELVIERGSGFGIAESQDGAGLERTFVSPDTAVCSDCLAELRDPDDRRFGHPFITCTNCGPRFTITMSLPYDRASTTMASFEMCLGCRTEYDDPADRRFHAQPIGCHECGPTIEWQTPNGDLAPTADAFATARSVLSSEGVVAVKGLGGFHLAASAVSEQAVARLRARKHRPDKPFAVMVATLDEARKLAHVSDAEAELLESRERPIVLCRAVEESALSDLVAPGNPLIGLMLPYTPIHHMLFDGSGDGAGLLEPLVMTSGNPGGEPICYRDDHVVSRIGHMVDGILTHDRPIHVPCDDSVVRVISRGLLPIRRARGYAPMPLSLPCEAADGEVDVLPAVLAVGGELKNAFCLTNGTHAWMSQHIGDMENLETLEAFTASVDQFCELYAVEPEIIAADTHPGYRSSGWARSNHGDRVAEVQHHHAHVAAVMAEHGIIPSVPVLGVVFDGTGDGTDGTIWGGELLVATASSYERVAHLRYTPLPGGDAAVRHPWRVALSHLRSAGISWEGTIAASVADPTARSLLARQLDRDLQCVPTSSMGRFFDALASLIGLRHSISYEAQAAIEFEILASSWHGPAPALSFSLADPTPLLAGVCAAMKRGVDPAAIARACHLAIANGVASEVKAQASARGISTVVLTGGVFQNVLLTELLAAPLIARGLDVRTHHIVPPNDGGLALGQAFVASARAKQAEGACRQSNESMATSSPHPEPTGV